MGPYGLALHASGSYRLAIVVLGAFILVGLALLVRVDVQQGAAAVESSAGRV